MNLTFESNLLVPPISEAISLLTNYALIYLDDIQYDKEKATVKIILVRREITGFKKSLLGNIQPLYGYDVTKSILTIKQVEDVIINVDEILRTELHSRFTALFGLKLGNTELYLCSAEENQGNLLCEIFIKVKGINIEIKDEM
jgi:hypothetical protein